MLSWKHISANISSICTRRFICGLLKTNSLQLTNYFFHWIWIKIVTILLFLSSGSCRSWLQSTLPSIQFWFSLDTHWTFCVPLLIHLNATVINNNCCPNHATKALHLLSLPNRPHTVQNQNCYKQAIMNDQKRKSSCTLRWCSSFSPKVKKISVQSALGLHSLFCQMQLEQKPVQRKP